MPRFSIAIPAYNRPEYLQQAIASCLNQTTTDLEVIVSDDCSAVDLAEVVRSFGDPRVRYHRNASNLRATKNHQAAVSRCTGEYVLTLNSDDLLLPDCLAVAGAALDVRTAAAAVYFSVTYLEGSQVAGSQAVPRLGFADGATLAANPWLEKFHGTTPSCCLFRRERFDRLGGYRTSLRLAYDWDLYMRFMRSGGGVVFLPRILAVYRRHAEQMVQTASLDGLRDVLDLWAEPEYAHWPAADIAGYVIGEAAAVLRSRAGLDALRQELRRRGLLKRILAGVPGGLVQRLVSRMRSSAAVDQNYETPADANAAIARASNLGLGFRGP